MLVVKFLLVMGRDLWPITITWLKTKKVLAVFMFFLILVLIALVSTSCEVPDAPQAQKKDEELLMPDLILEWHSDHGLRRFKGTGVLPVKSVYEFEIVAPGNIDAIQISTCHRVFLDPPKPSIFKDEKRYRFTYMPNKAETNRPCPLKIQVFEMGRKEMYAHGVFHFKTPQETLPAVVYCNGARMNTIGVSVCANLSGLNTIADFLTPVEVTAQPGCEIPKSIDGLTWEWDLIRHECAYLFFEMEGDRRHRMTTYGADIVPVRME